MVCSRVLGTLRAQYTHHTITSFRLTLLTCHSIITPCQVLHLYRGAPSRSSVTVPETDAPRPVEPPGGFQI